MSDINSDELISVIGETRALHIVLKKLINTLPPAQAAKMAVGVAIELEVVRSSRTCVTSEPETASQIQALESFVEHLSAVAKQKL